MRNFFFIFLIKIKWNLIVFDVFIFTAYCSILKLKILINFISTKYLLSCIVFWDDFILIIKLCRALWFVRRCHGRNWVTFQKFWGLFDINTLLTIFFNFYWFLIFSFILVNLKPSLIFNFIFYLIVFFLIQIFIVY